MSEQNNDFVLDRRQKMGNETKHAFEVKSHKHCNINEEDLIDAAKFAIMEASEWDDAIIALQKYGARFECQICVLLMYSIELYLKAIIMTKGIGISEKLKTHKVKELFNYLDESEQQIIKEGANLPIIDFGGFDGEEYIRIDSFESALDFISNDFINLRYQFEKYVFGEPIYFLNKFVFKLRDDLKNIAKSTVYPEES